MTKITQQEDEENDRLACYESEYHVIPGRGRGKT